MAEKKRETKTNSGLGISGVFSGPSFIVVPRLLFIVATLALLCLGLVMIFSASSVEALAETGDAMYYFKRQLVMIFVGLVAAVAASVIPYNVWQGRVAWGLWGASVILLLFTVVIGYATGNAVNGATRWLYVGGIGFQPSEFTKIATMLLAAFLMQDHQRESGRRSTQRRRSQGSGLRGYFQGNKYFISRIFLCVGVPCLLIFVQPDLGTLVITVVGVIAILWFGEAPTKIIVIIFAVLVVIGLFGIVAYGFRGDRIQAWLDPWGNADGTAYQVVNGFYAFGDGGIFGLGLGMSRQKYSYLPEAHTDFIFAIVGEELGLIGAVAVVLLFLLFIYAGIMIARAASDLAGRMIAGAATCMIGFQAFLNIMCVIGWFPLTGKPLPFLSYGGSSVIATMIMVGLVLSVSLHTKVNDKAARRRKKFQVIEGGA